MLIAFALATGLIAAIQVNAKEEPPIDRSSIVRASSAGARLDSHLFKGGGTDDTQALQRVLDRAANGRPVHLIIDGAALVTGLDVHGSTTIECTAGGGLFLKPKSSRAIIRNANRTRGKVVDERIEIDGCFLNGNRDEQPWAHLPFPGQIAFSIPSNREADGTFISGVQFAGVKNLKIRDVTIWNVRAMGAVISNAQDVDIRNVTVDHGEPEGPGQTVKVLITDGLNFKGPLKNVFIDSVTFRTGDDAIALSPNDWDTDDLTQSNGFGPYVGQGPVEDVTINNVFLKDALFGIRIFSTTERVDRVAINNVSGTVKWGLLKIHHWMNEKSFGNVGEISISNVNVRRVAMGPTNDAVPSAKKFVRTGQLGADGTGLPFILLEDRIESLTLTNWATQATDDRPILQIGPKADVDYLNIDLRVADPNGIANVIDTYRGARIGRFDLSLNWYGKDGSYLQDPFLTHEAQIGELNWRDMPAKWKAPVK